MYDSAALLDIHERADRNFRQLLDHCRKLSYEELHRVMDGFGDGTVQLQLHHVLTASRYWIGVIEGRIIADDDAPEYDTIDKLEMLRQEVFEQTRNYLEHATSQELSTPRKMMTWGDNERVLKPAAIFMRTVTHQYHHAGQVAAMSRLMGTPFEWPGINFPLED